MLPAGGHSSNIILSSFLGIFRIGIFLGHNYLGHNYLGRIILVHIILSSFWGLFFGLGFFFDQVINNCYPGTEFIPSIGLFYNTIKTT